MSDRHGSVERSLYQLGIACCPPAFRREYGTEMLRDFDAARRDSTSDGEPTGLWTWRVAVSLDLARTIATQWMRSGWPVFVALSMLAPLLLVGGLANLLQHTSFQLPTNTPDAESIGLVLMATVVLVVIATTILFTAWFAASARRRSKAACFKRAT
jgi:hypothetical protein